MSVRKILATSISTMRITVPVSRTIDPRARTVILKATEAGENHLRFERTMASYS